VTTASPTCDFCGTHPPADQVGTLPLTWTTAVEKGQQRVYCATCSREHLRAIEGKLDSEWW
jgi:hypothetical protein